MKIVVAIDSFKGCLTSAEANRAAAEGVRAACPDAAIIEVPVSDGGEGFLEAFHAAFGGERIEAAVRDPLMRPITAHYLLRGRTAVIEIAQASGLTLLTADERNPLVATSYGTGLLIADAVNRGARQLIVGLGGSATSDAGKGMIRALIDTFAPQGGWDDIKELNGVRVTIASDVKNPLCGANGAAHVFAPQKGATTEMVRLLDGQARRFADAAARHFGFDHSAEAGAGAAGGLGYAFMQYMNAECKPGIDLLLNLIKFDEMVSHADLIITGEGSADRQTLMGKLPTGILRHSADTPVGLIAGRISDRDELHRAGFAHVACINPEGMAPDEAMRKDVAQRNIYATVRRMLTHATGFGTAHLLVDGSAGMVIKQ